MIEIYGMVIDPETDAFTLGRDTLSNMGVEENNGVDHHETIGHRVPGNMEFSWLYDEYMEAQGEEEKDKFDFVVSRAVMPLGDLIKIIRKNISQEQHNALPKRTDLPERRRIGTGNNACEAQNCDI